MELSMLLAMISAAPTVFPPTEARALDGTLHLVPLTLPGRWRILIVGFAMEHQAQIDRWFEALAPLAGSVRELTIWEIPVGPPLPLWQRMMIDGGMRSALPDPAVQARTITLYTPVEPLKEALGLERLGIHVLLLDADGRVRWRTEEAPSAALLTTLAEQLRG